MRKKVDQIAAFGDKLIGIHDTDRILSLIADAAKALVGAERCSIFRVDAEDEILWTKLSDGIGRIVIGLDAGVVGATYETKKPQIVNNPYDDARFLSNIDKKSGYKTKNMITVPIFDSKRNIMAVLQLLNKKEMDFNDKDLELLTFFANYVSGKLELALMSEK